VSSDPIAKDGFTRFSTRHTYARPEAHARHTRESEHHGRPNHRLRAYFPSDLPCPGHLSAPDDARESPTPA